MCEQYIEGIERELLMGDGREDEKKCKLLVAVEWKNIMMRSL